MRDSRSGAEVCGIRLIAGLGNPGAQYAGNRHNAGFWFVERLAREYRGDFKRRDKLHGAACRINVASQALWLFKPTTFMNESGRAVAAFAGFYKIETPEILIAHDEIDFPAARLRLKSKGGHGGHNGLASVIQHLGADFWRLRIGISHPGSKSRVTPHVLGDPDDDEAAAIHAALAHAADIVEDLAKGRFEQAMNTLHANPETN